MIQFVPYQSEHFTAMVPTEGQTGFVADVSAKFHENYPATTALDGDTPIAAFGITPLWEGVAEVWAIFDERHIRDHGVFMVKSTRQFLDQLMEDHHRIQCFVYAKNHRLTKFVENFGFKREGVMQKYGPTGEDFYMYARVKQ